MQGRFKQGDILMPRLGEGVGLFEETPEWYGLKHVAWFNHPSFCMYVGHPIRSREFLAPMYKGLIYVLTREGRLLLTHEISLESVM